MSLPQREQQIEEAHYAYLTGLDPGKQWGVKYLYDRLNIIDAKTSALLRVNSTIIGFLGAIVALIPRAQPGFPPHKGLFLIFAIAILMILAASDILSLRIFRLKFDHVENNDFVKYRDHFFEVTHQRQKVLGWVIRLSRIGELGFVILFVGLAFFEL